jgi:hypothetical protein
MNMMHDGNAELSARIDPLKPAVIVAYAAMLAILALMYAPLGGAWLLARNVSRAACGPLHYLVRDGLNDLHPHLMIAMSFWTAWLLLVCLTRIRHWHPGIHFAFAACWCGVGVLASLAI